MIPREDGGSGETWPRFCAALGARLQDELDGLARVLDAAEPALRRAPAPGAWSAVEIVEHVTLANRFLSILAAKLAQKGAARARRGLAPPAEPPPLAHLDSLSGRSFRWAHPPHMAPGGEVPVATLRARLAEQRAHLSGLLASSPRGEGSLHRIRISVVPGDDRLDLYQLLHFVLLHAARHRAQAERALGGLSGEPRPPVA